MVESDFMCMTSKGIRLPGQAWWLTEAVMKIIYHTQDSLIPPKAVAVLWENIKLEVSITEHMERHINYMDWITATRMLTNGASLFMAMNVCLMRKFIQERCVTVLDAQWFPLIFLTGFLRSSRIRTGRSFCGFTGKAPDTIFLITRLPD